MMQEIERIIEELSHSVIDKMEGKGFTRDVDVDVTVSLLDIYQRLLETESQINQTLSRFRGSLDRSTNSDMVNQAILRFTGDFYNLRDSLNRQMRLYNSVHFSGSQEATLGKKYMDKCFDRIDKDLCLAHLVKKHLSA